MSAPSNWMNQPCPACGAWGPHACTGQRSMPPIIPPARAPVMCPICKGHLVVPKGFYETAVLGAMPNDARTEPCRSCHGRGIV